MITIVDYNTGNPYSIANMLKRIGYDCKISGNIEVIKQAKAIILPGVGSFDIGMSNLKMLHLDEVLTDLAIHKKIPFLGICLGMQLMCKESEEGSLTGLGWFDCKVARFNTNGYQSLKVPHIGWENVFFKNDSIFSAQKLNNPKFYFAHMYHPTQVHKKHELCTTTYGYSFTSGLNSGNIYGVQFHPEKSHTFGMTFLKLFFDDFL